MRFKAYPKMNVSSEHEISWANALYPQYQVYEHRVNTFVDRFWPMSLHQNAVTMASAGFFYSGNGDIVICAFCGLYLYRWLPNDDPFTEHKKFNDNCKFVSLFQDFDNQPTIQYHGLFMKIKSVCYNAIHFLTSTFSNLKNVIFFYFYKKFSNKFAGTRFHSLCKICLNEGSNTLLLPCHHVSTCHFCTICIKFCPICRCEIKSIIKVYFA